MKEQSPNLVVLGMDADGKPHACWFSDADAEVATRAARLMEFHAVKVKEPELKKLAFELPAGRVFASGKAFCPFVKRDLYDKFAILVGTPSDVGQKPSESSEPANSKVAKAKGAPPAIPDPWASITVGSIVLATVGKADGWWESVVLTTEQSDDTLTLTWRDWPRMPAFRVPRRSVAVLEPQTR